MCERQSGESPRRRSRVLDEGAGRALAVRGPELVARACQWVVLALVVALALGLAALMVTPRSAAPKPLTGGTLPGAAQPSRWMNVERGPSLSEALSVLQDCSPGGLVAESVVRQSHRFVPLPDASQSFGYSPCAFWFKFSLSDTPPGPRRWHLVVENARVDRADLYRLVRDTGELEVVRSGALVPWERRPVQHRHPVLPLTGLGPEPTDFFLRLQTSDVATFPLRLVSSRAMAAVDRQEHLVQGLYYGVVLFAAVFNLFVFFFLRDSTYLIYTAFLASYSGFQATVDGAALEYLWPQAPALTAFAIPVTCGAAIITGVAFTWRFLGFSGEPQGLRGLALGTGASGVAVILFAAAGEVRFAGALGSSSSLLAVLVIALLCFHASKRDRVCARYYVLATLALLLGITLNVLRNSGALPSSLLTTHGNQLGSILNVLLLNMALLARFNLLQREKVSAQELALRSQKLAAENERRSMEFKVRALQAQINPHFFFNTLNTLVGLIGEDPQRAETIVIRLSQLFRQTLAMSETRQVRLTDELLHVKTYLEIEKMRFGDRLEYVIHSQGALDRMSLPGLTLQPLVENAIKHGLMPKLEGGKVTISAHVAETSCTLVVLDDGVGGCAGETPEGHGLRSVRERLKMAFGDAFGMRICAQEGFRVTMVLPVGETI